MSESSSAEAWSETRRKCIHPGVLSSTGSACLDALSPYLHVRSCVSMMIRVSKHGALQAWVTRASDQGLSWFERLGPCAMLCRMTLASCCARPAWHAARRSVPNCINAVCGRKLMKALAGPRALAAMRLWCTRKIFNAPSACISITWFMWRHPMHALHVAIAGVFEPSSEQVLRFHGTLNARRCCWAKHIIFLLYPPCRPSLTGLSLHAGSFQEASSLR